MQGVAAWLVARPHNGILALAASAALVMLPLLQVVSGVVMMLLTLMKEKTTSNVAFYVTSGILQ